MWRSEFLANSDSCENGERLENGAWEKAPWVRAAVPFRGVPGDVGVHVHTPETLLTLSLNTGEAKFQARE